VVYVIRDVPLQADEDEGDVRGSATNGYEETGVSAATWPDTRIPFTHKRHETRTNGFVHSRRPSLPAPSQEPRRQRAATHPCVEAGGGSQSWQACEIAYAGREEIVHRAKKRLSRHRESLGEYPPARAELIEFEYRFRPGGQRPRGRFLLDDGRRVATSSLSKRRCLVCSWKSRGAIGHEKRPSEAGLGPWFMFSSAPVTRQTGRGSARGWCGQRPVSRGLFRLLRAADTASS
jgi:hypothetical protein